MIDMVREVAFALARLPNAVDRVKGSFPEIAT